MNSNNINYFAHIYTLKCLDCKQTFDSNKIKTYFKQISENGIEGFYGCPFCESTKIVKIDTDIKEIDGIKYKVTLLPGDGTKYNELKEEVKTSKEWYTELLKTQPKLNILDPDGWDRKCFDYSFNKELISKLEFNRRLMLSTIEGFKI